MKKLNLTISSLFASLLLFTSCQKEVTTANYGVIPLPQSIEKVAGEAFELSGSTSIVYPKGNADLERTAQFLAEYLKFSTGLTLTVTDEDKTDNVIILKDGLKHENKEAYALEVGAKQVIIEGASPAGTFYGVQTLRKSIDADANGHQIMLPQVKITDYPRFQYRGMMLDVARHYFPVEFIKKYIDILALHNINKFHWHLTEDQGWRLEIKKYPKLTEIGSKRTETVIGHNTGKYDGKPYGGFYTQEEAKEIVAYAQDRFITVIPEIDLPGHMLGALTAYPELGCTGGPYQVAREWGVFEDVLCVGNDNTIDFLKDVFTELIEIFPSEYIHVGGDECPKARWKTCPTCQAKIRQLGLRADKAHSAEDKLQSYCISTIEKFLNEKGRKIIGWDEILEGGLAPNATVMSWRGTAGGIKAAQQKHDVIMVPTDYAYFDYYQSADVKNEPIAIGGYVPLEKVYSFDPVPSVLTDEEKKYIIGNQANLWVEYISTTEQVEYMVLPRISALAETQWTMPEKKDLEDYISRLKPLMKYYEKSGYNAAKTIFDLNGTVTSNKDKKQIEIALSTADDNPVHYTLDGTKPTKDSKLYTEPIVLKEAATVNAAIIRPEGASKLYTQAVNLNKASFKPVKLETTPHANYTFNGGAKLVDGIAGSESSFKDGTWLGFYGEDAIAIIDLGEETEVSEVRAGTFVGTGDWIFGATGLTVSASDKDVLYKVIANNSYFEVAQGQPGGRVNLKVKFEPIKTRYLKVRVSKTRKIPDWHPGKGQKAFLFVDEFEVY